MRAASLSVACFALILSSCTPGAITAHKPFAGRGAAAMRDQLAGNWYGDMRTKEGGTNRWLTRRKLDGTYSIDFVITDATGRVSRDRQFGDWGVTGNYYVTLTRAIRDRDGLAASDKRDSYSWDVYRIIRFDSGHFEYENVSTGNRFSARRVDSSFALDAPRGPVQLIDPAESR